MNTITLTRQKLPISCCNKDDMIQSMKELNHSLTQFMKMISDDLSKTFDDLKESNSFLEVSFNEARLEASEAKKNKYTCLMIKSQINKLQLKNKKRKLLV